MGKKTKEKIELGTLIGIFIISVLGVSNLHADEMVHKFKNPSFSGIGTSAHYLTIENQEFTRKMTIKEEIKALQEQIERDAENTTLARFIRNLESRIYAQISRQIVENMFTKFHSIWETVFLNLSLNGSRINHWTKPSGNEAQ